MKKVLVVVLTVTAAAVAAQAQGVARDFNTFAEYAPTITPVANPAPAKANASVKKTLKAALAKVEREIQKQHIAFLRAEQQKAEVANQAQATSEVKTTKDQTTPAAQTTDKKAADKPAVNTQKKTADKKEETYEGSFWGYLGFGPYPGETHDQYRAHLESQSYAAGQPFK